MFENLKYVSPLIEGAVKNEFPVGARVAVIHKGETVYRESFGYADREKGIKMSENTIFRLYSLSKPITATAAMILLERGLIELRYPAKWFLDVEGLPTILDENGERTASRDVTIADLLTMTSGIPYPDGSPAGMKMGELWGRQADAYENGGELLNTREFAKKMLESPLCFEPGEKWMYGSSADVLGAVIEAASGKPYGQFLKDEIFEPLGMNNTGFYIPEDNYHNLAAAYNFADGENKRFTEHTLCLTDFSKPPAFESGGAGLTATMEDYEKFVKMLLGKGTYNGTRILGRKTVELMTKNYLSPAQTAQLDWDSMKGQGYGCLMRVLEDRRTAGRNGTEGEYGWDGWLGCYFSIDPAEELAMLYFIQQTNSGCTDFTRKIQNVIWGALD